MKVMIIVAAGRGLFSIGLMLRNAKGPPAEPRLHGGLRRVGTAHPKRLFRTWWDVARAMIKAAMKHRPGAPGNTGWAFQTAILEDRTSGTHS